MQEFDKLQYQETVSSSTYSKKQQTYSHKITMKSITLKLENNQNILGPSSSVLMNSKAIQNSSNLAKINPPQSQKKILILDDSIIDESPNNQNLTKIISPINNLKNTTKKKRSQPLNPFEQILHEYDTPDFNGTLPFVEEFSQIDMKSPTFSDVFNLSELKSPQINYQQQSNKYFAAPKKLQKTIKEYKIRNPDQQWSSQNKKQIIDLNLTLDFNKKKKIINFQDQKSLISSIKISKPLQTPTKKSSQQSKVSKPLTPTKIMSQQTYKLRNHQNPSTPRIKNIANLAQDRDKKQSQKSVKIQNYESVESNPETEGISSIPSVSKNEVKDKISPRLVDSTQMTDNLPTKRLFQFYDTAMYMHSSPRCNVTKTSPYKKISIKKLQLEQQLEQIYNGKFKLNRTMRF